ncbi:hypothetical protein EVAR_26997_1 [Eumeta japonica]|uniref:Uncharacterized protein n=1 Tax=Eumeta variegata TaxID=151549 RepID=A0A4C1VKY8_EUMVA|nr:hypothetical protein EVAR_26997_1 [Eumeta japonica]
MQPRGFPSTMELFSSKRVDLKTLYIHRSDDGSCPRIPEDDVAIKVSFYDGSFQWGNRTFKAPECRWSPPPMDTYNSKGVTTALSPSWIEIIYPMEGDVGRRSLFARPAPGIEFTRRLRLSNSHRYRINFDGTAAQPPIELYERGRLLEVYNMGGRTRSLPVRDKRLCKFYRNYERQRGIFQSDDGDARGS